MVMRTGRAELATDKPAQKRKKGRGGHGFLGGSVSSI